MVKMNWDKVNKENQIKNSSSIPYPKIKKRKPKKNHTRKGKIIKSQYDGICTYCHKSYNKDDKIFYHFVTKNCFHISCPKEHNA